MNEPRILVTGGSGLLGSYLLRWFKENGYTNLTATFQKEESIPTDLKEGIVWRQLILPDLLGSLEIVKDKDWVIHTAAMVSYEPADKYALLNINRTGTENIVNACLAHDVKHLIYISSIAALGKEVNHVVLDETGAWVDNEYSTPYGLSKYLGELEIWRGANEGLNVSVILPSVILGTGNWKNSSLQLIDRIAKKLPWYPGGQTGYVDVRDVVRFIGLLLVNDHSGERWILNAVNLSYKEMYERLGKKLGSKKKYREAPEWMARIAMRMSGLKNGRWSVPDLMHQVYGTFSYDSSKSLTLEGFHYKPIDETMDEVVGVYLGKGETVVLNMESDPVLTKSRKV